MPHWSSNAMAKAVRSLTKLLLRSEKQGTPMYIGWLTGFRSGKKTGSLYKAGNREFFLFGNRFFDFLPKEK